MADDIDPILDQLRLHIRKPGDHRYAHAVEETLHALKVALRGESDAARRADLQRLVRQAIEMLAKMDLPAWCEAVHRDCQSHFVEAYETAGESTDIEPAARVAVQKAHGKILGPVYDFARDHKIAAGLIDAGIKTVLDAVLPGLGIAAGGAEGAIRSEDRQNRSDENRSAAGTAGSLAADTTYAVAAHSLTRALPVVGVALGGPIGFAIGLGLSFAFSYVVGDKIIRERIDPGDAPKIADSHANHGLVHDLRAAGSFFRRVGRSLYSELHR